MPYKCCNKIRRPKLFFRASIGDMIGILFLGGFFGSILFLIGWAFFSAMASEINDYGKDSFDVRAVAAYLLFIALIIKALPYFFKLLSFFIDFKLTYKTVCNQCNKEIIKLDLPTKNDPF